jgi:glutamate racemase
MQKNQLYQVRINKHKNTLKKNPTLRVGFFYFYKLMNSIEDKPIGFFDSGVGGTSIWKEVHQLLPNESTIYLADSKNAPYGKKSKEKIIEFSIKNTEFLLNKNAKIIIVACNTATTNAISILRKKYDIPFIGIEPAIKPAGLITKTKKIGVLATQGTIQSDLFEQTSSSLDTTIEIIEQVGEGLVDLIEKGEIESKQMQKLLYKYLNPMIEKNIDALVLGCSHFPYLIPHIKDIIGNKIKIIDSGSAVARQTKKILTRLDILQNNKNNLTHEFYSNKNTKILSELLNNKKVKLIKQNF